ncbi:aminoacyl-tRNA hydrolase [Enterococcus timonensis]|uniref:aminoacyl-tRNA hydrolase n=1 Tax=Enterococcus timonensis TaxID=1852364 RepID=UPI0008D9DBAE|nr:aminoacyl-tRNA hydrolase [Enterococcus timonensis]
MRAIIGLGNPGKKYEKTKHNVGFMVVDAIAKEFNVTMKRHTFEAEVGDFFYEGEKILLIKPLTFMNDSGRAAGPLLTYYNLTPQEAIIVCDDLDMQMGKVRLREHGSAGGHNGLKSLIAHFKTTDFPRIKVGIGRPKKEGQTQVVHHVLAPFSVDEQIDIDPALKKAQHTALYFASGHTFNETMNFAAKE